MGQLVCEQGGQEQQRRHHTRDPVGCGTLPGHGVREVAGGEAPGYERANDQDAPVQAHVDARDAAQAQVLVHALHLLSSRTDEGPAGARDPAGRSRGLS